MPRLEALFKGIATRNNMKINRAPGLGTYFRAIRDAGVFERRIAAALEKFCEQRNQVVHEEATYSVSKIRQAALICTSALAVLQRAYPLGTP